MWKIKCYLKTTFLIGLSSSVIWLNDPQGFDNKDKIEADFFDLL